jgi:hypothetical protein
MCERVNLNRVKSAFERLEFPVTRDDAAAELVDVTVASDDDEANLGELVSEMGSDAFHTPDDLHAELEAVLPAGMVRDPGQSDEDADSS